MYRIIIHSYYLADNTAQYCSSRRTGAKERLGGSSPTSTANGLSMLLVTGGAGFIGSNVVASLNEAGRTDITVNDILGSDGKWRNLSNRQIADFVPPADLLRWLGGPNYEGAGG